MTEAGLYERLRLLLNSMSILPLPRHEATFRLLTNLFEEEEAEIAVSCFNKVNEPVQIDELSKRAPMPRDDLVLKLDDMVGKGLIRKASSEDYRPELCIGCGICASNCPHEAITMQKTRNIEPAANFMELAINSFKSKTH